jgi:hypothetical protein
MNNLVYIANILIIECSIIKIFLNIMKYISLLPLLLILSIDCHSQSFDTLLNRGKAQFKSGLEKPDYKSAVNNLQKAVTLNPGSAEAHYFLGYAYSRVNSNDASAIPKMRLPLVEQASAEFEQVNTLTPLYTGEIVTLDPYSKITSEWGALALSYLAKATKKDNKKDSVKWAFKAGKTRGGFDDFILAINRSVLNHCSTNSILMVSGDDYIFPLYYLQIIEKLRTDVTIVNISMLNTDWYPRFIERTTPLKFGINEPALDTLNYKHWADSTINIPVDQTTTVFSWILKPTFKEHFIQRGDRLFLSLLQENKFKRDVYFTKSITSDEQLGLNDNLLLYPVVNKINATNEKPESDDQYIAEVQKLVSTFTEVNPNSLNELMPINVIRTEIFEKIDNTTDKNANGIGFRLVKLLDDYLPENDFPTYSDSIKKYLKYLAGN